MKLNHKPKILMTGGGTLGPVIPLLNLKEIWHKKNSEIDFSWIGTLTGPEREFVEKFGIEYFALTSPKLSRHQPWKWIFIPFHLLFSLIWAFILLKKISPDLMITTGAYVSVPVAFICKLFGVPIWVHQLDIEVGLANKIMSPLAERISVTFEQSLNVFSEKKTQLVGAIINNDSFDKGEAKKKLHLKMDKPLLLVMGGGTGAVSINEAMLAIGEELMKDWQVVHLTGKGKMIDDLDNIGEDYYAEEIIIDEMSTLWAAADLVVARGGLGTLLDIIKYGKASIIIPIMGSHQEKNADFMENAGVAKVLRNINGQILLTSIKSMLDNRLERELMENNVINLLDRGGGEKIIGGMEEILKERFD